MAVECFQKAQATQQEFARPKVLGSADYTVSAMLCALPAVGLQSGFALAAWVRDHHPNIKIVLAGTVDAAAEAAAEFCAGPRLARPYDPAAIVARIELMRQRQRQNLSSDGSQPS